MVHVAFALLALVHWIVVSDTHLDPFDVDSVPSSFTYDTNRPLFDSALAAMRKADPDPQMVLIGGDFLVHRFPELSQQAHGKGFATRDALDTIRSQASAFDRAFPHARFVVTLGNNDDPCGDYRSEADGAYTRAIASIWQPLVERGTRDPQFERTFAQGGYGVVRALGGRVRIVTLNSVYWSFFYRGTCNGRTSAGDDEFAWLEETLAHTPSGVRNIVLMHIPPGIDASTTDAVHVVGVPYWHERYRHKLDSIFEDPKSGVLWSIAGHTHRSDMRLAGGVPMFLAGSLSPVSRNRPTFFVLDVEDDGTLRDIHPYQYDEESQQWSAVASFDTFWAVSAFTAEAIREIHAKLAVDPALRARWAQRYTSYGYRLDTINESTWRVFWCAQTSGGDAYAACSGSHRVTSVVIASIVGVGFVILVLVAFLAAAIFLRRRAPINPS